MSARMNYVKAAPAAFKAMLAVEQAIRDTLDAKLVHLVKVRASQINGCAYCIDMHWKDARADGETEERLYMLAGWHESELYTDRERAALAWTESLTNVSQTHAPDDVYEEARSHFAEQDLANLTWAIAAINAWNRIAIGFRAEPGKYQAPAKKG